MICTVCVRVFTLMFCLFVCVWVYCIVFNTKKKLISRSVLRNGFFFLLCAFKAVTIFFVELVHLSQGIVSSVACLGFSSESTSGRTASAADTIFAAFLCSSVDFRIVRPRKWKGREVSPAQCWVHLFQCVTNVMSFERNNLCWTVWLLSGDTNLQIVHSLCPSLHLKENKKRTDVCFISTGIWCSVFGSLDICFALTQKSQLWLDKENFGSFQNDTYDKLK